MKMKSTVIFYPYLDFRLRRELGCNARAGDLLQSGNKSFNPILPPHPSTFDLSLCISTHLRHREIWRVLLYIKSGPGTHDSFLTFGTLIYSQVILYYFILALPQCEWMAHVHIKCPASRLTWVILSKGLWADVVMMVSGNIYTKFGESKSWPFVSRILAA